MYWSMTSTTVTPWQVAGASEGGNLVGYLGAFIKVFQCPRDTIWPLIVEAMSSITNWFITKRIIYIHPVNTVHSSNSLLGSANVVFGYVIQSYYSKVLLEPMCFKD